ncbi:F-box protein [Salix suchowensis]|nr:F-box protein [Salix suchowensis]
MDGFDRLPDSLILIVFTTPSRHQGTNPRTPTRSSLSSNRSSNPSTISSIPTPNPQLETKPRTPRPESSPVPPIRDLQIELPAGDLKLEKGAAIKWRAEFGKSLKSCVILGFRRAANPEGNSAGAEIDFTGGLKTRVVWTISALIAASARHYLLNDVVKEHREMERLVLVDREGEGTVAMEKEGLRECREESRVAARGGECREESRVAARGGEWEEDGRRTVVPCVRMRMRHEQRVQLKNGVWIEDVTLVVVRPCSVGGDGEDAELALGAFGGGIDGEAVQVLLKNKSYLLEMNSF